MTPLRKRFIEDLQLHGYAPSTQQVYVSAIKQVAGHYHRSPDELTEEQIRQYFLHLTLVRKVSRSNATIALCALKFFCEHTLQRAWPVFALARPRREKKLPVVLSREEVRQLLGALQGPVYRAYFTTVYACGLRLEEARQLQISDVDGQRGLLRIRGKGNNYAKVVVTDRCRFTDFAGTVFWIELGSSSGTRKVGEISEKMACFGFRSDRETLYECIGSPTNGGQSTWHNSQALRIGSAFPRLHC